MNIIAFLNVSKLFYFFLNSPKLSEYKFFWNDLFRCKTEEKIIEYLKFVKKKKISKFEILIHPGFASKKEKNIKELF